MRLGASETLTFSSGRPAIRATKLRYYTDPSFKRLAQIPPPPRSDRIEFAFTLDEDTEQPKSDTQKDVAGEVKTDQPVPGVTGKTRQAKSVPVEQLSFLKFAVDKGNAAAEAPKEDGVKERLL